MPLVVVVGQGYVGLPLAMRAVEVGHRVVGFDTDEVRTARLAAGDSYIDDVPSASSRLRWPPVATWRRGMKRRARGSTWPSSRCRPR